MASSRKTDEELIKAARTAIKKAVGAAESKSKVAKALVMEAARQRNRGRTAAMRRHPFRGICEASGAPLDECDKVLDELDPELGYQGRVRWVCPKANNSGKRSCGVC